MKFVIIGSGIIGLSVAKVLIDKKVCSPSKILVIVSWGIKKIYFKLKLS